nr:BMP family ABC transporter substrate-binding protein [Ornithinimicrobium sp. HY1745]
MVSDAGGFDDQSFNQGAYSGLLAAEESLGITKAEAESNSDAEFGPNIDAMVQQGCNYVIGVGFLLEDAIQAAAEANPDTNFGLLDSGFQDADFAPVELENGKPILFNTSEAAFLAGYLAAGMTETDKVATYGGLPIPSVQIFMDGFSDGVDAYNEDNGSAVELLGWDKEAQNGSFANTFDDQSQGASLGEQFISQGADIIMPVAGPVGLGTASVAEGTDTKLIWVDSDGFLTTEYGDLILTSVLKDMGPAVEATIKEGVDGAFTNEPYVGTLENEGVSLAPFHDFDAEVPQELKDKIAEYQEQIVSGELVVESPNAP